MVTRATRAAAAVAYTLHEGRLPPPPPPPPQPPPPAPPPEAAICASGAPAPTTTRLRTSIRLVDLVPQSSSFVPQSSSFVPTPTSFVPKASSSFSSFVPKASSFVLRAEGVELRAEGVELLELRADGVELRAQVVEMFVQFLTDTTEWIWARYGGGGVLRFTPARPFGGRCPPAPPEKAAYVCAVHGGLGHEGSGAHCRAEADDASGGTQCRR